MRKGIHKVKVGDLVQRAWPPQDRSKLFMVIEILDPRNCATRPLKAHEVELILWDVSEPADWRNRVPSNLCELTGGN